MKKIDLTTEIGNIKLKTPLLTTSGTSGSSNEILRLNNNKDILDALGAFVTKGVTLNPRDGNPVPRVIETRSGIINSIGLQNNGARSFLINELPKLTAFNLPIIVNISAPTVEEFGVLAELLATKDENRQIVGLEINVSCPNIKEGGVAFGTKPKLIYEVVKKVRRVVPNWISVITKLSPNVTDIVECGTAAVEGGSDALSMINTLKAMAIDIETKKPILGNKYGGLSGPAIRPIGVYMVYECFSKIPACRSKSVPIIGIGGIANDRDAIEYILAGASAIGIGTEWFVNNLIFNDVRSGIKMYLKEHNVQLTDLVGAAHGN